MTPVPSPPDAALPTLERPLYLLTFFTAKDPAWTLSKLAKASGLPSASCLRAIRVLEKYQFLRRDHMEYRLGSQLVRLSANALASSPARRLALPYLEQLHRLTTRPVSWSVLEGPTGHTIEVVASPDHPAHQVQAGMQMNLTGGAPARVLLAFAPQELRRHVLEVHWAEYPHSRSSHEMLDGLARNTWLALEVHAQPSPTIEIAAPVFQGDGALIAALGLERPAGSSSSRAAIEQDLVLLNQTAQRISRELGYTREWRGDPAFFLQVIKSANVLTFTEDAAVGTDLINYPA